MPPVYSIIIFHLRHLPLLRTTHSNSQCFCHCHCHHGSLAGSTMACLCSQLWGAMHHLFNTLLLCLNLLQLTPCCQCCLLLLLLFSCAFPRLFHLRGQTHCWVISALGCARASFQRPFLLFSHLEPGVSCRIQPVSVSTVHYPLILFYCLLFCVFCICLCCLKIPYCPCSVYNISKLSVNFSTFQLFMH